MKRKLVRFLPFDRSVLVCRAHTHSDLMIVFQELLESELAGVTKRARPMDISPAVAVKLESATALTGASGDDCE